MRMIIFALLILNLSVLAADESRETLKNNKQTTLTDSNIRATYIDSSSSIVFTNIDGVQEYGGDPWDPTTIRNIRPGMNFYVRIGSSSVYTFHVYKKEEGSVEVGIILNPESIQLPSKQNDVVASPASEGNVPEKNDDQSGQLGPDGYIGTFSVLLDGGLDFNSWEYNSSRTSYSSDHTNRFSGEVSVLYSATPGSTYGLHVGNQRAKVGDAVSFSTSTWSVHFQVRLYSSGK